MPCSCSAFDRTCSMPCKRYCKLFFLFPSCLHSREFPAGFVQSGKIFSGELHGAEYRRRGRRLSHRMRQPTLPVFNKGVCPPEFNICNRADGFLLCGGTSFQYFQAERLLCLRPGPHHYLDLMTLRAVLWPIAPFEGSISS